MILGDKNSSTMLSNNMNNCIIIPVRSGSKGLPNKNILKFCGIPLLGYVLQKLSSSKLFDHVIVSSDSTEYLDIAQHYGATDLIERPRLLATDKTPTNEVVKHAIVEFEAHRSQSNDRYFLTQVTSPLWSQDELQNFIKASLAASSSIVSVSISKQNPEYNLLKKSQNGYSLMNESSYNRRQDHPEVYFINGCFYSFKKNTLINTGLIREPECEIFLMDSLTSMDIDSSTDFDLCELAALHLISK